MDGQSNAHLASQETSTLRRSREEFERSSGSSWWGRELWRDRLGLLELGGSGGAALAPEIVRRGGRSLRVGPGDGYDLGTSLGLRRALELVKEKQPRHLWVSMPSGPEVGPAGPGHMPERSKDCADLKYGEYAGFPRDFVKVNTAKGFMAEVRTISIGASQVSGM